MRAEGAASAIELALESAGIEAGQVACILSAGSGGRAGDEMEARALEKVFGPLLHRIPACAPKAALGESLGAAGAFGALLAALALQRQCLPPTVGSQGTDHGIRLDARPQDFQGDFALVNAFSCDGNNAAMLLRRWTE